MKLVIDHLEKQPDLDILMCDYEIIKNGQSKEVFHYKNRNSSVEMSGLRFVELQETPWVAWLYAYRLNFLDSHCLRFEENTLFEDKDFVLESTIKASCIQYMPILLVQYHIHDKQTCNVGSDIEKITALFWNCYRTRCVSERNRIYGQKAFRALMDHHLFAFNSYLKRFFWRLPYMKMREVLTKYPPHCPEKGYLLIWLCVKFPRMFCLITLGAKPWLHLAHAVKRVICA